MRTVAALIAVSLLPAQTPEAARTRLLRGLDDRAPVYNKLARQVWEFAETGYQEKRSADLWRMHLRGAGFRIRDRVGDVPTAFVAEWGSGKPVVAILGEYDALPGLSQDAVAERKPVAKGAPGHGCGHNLLGAAAAFASVAVKDHLERNKLAGTIRFYGTPAEEGGGGKVYMARAGAFDGADVALTWHPANNNHASLASTLANISAKFRFHGTAAHAAASPQAGRSALDALSLMNHAVELLREHVPQETRIHYIITSGGAAPNIVPDFAEAFYYARHPRMAQLDGIWERILKCAQAAALATETRLETEIVNSVWDLLPNEPLSKLLDKNLRAVGGVTYTPAERSFAEALRKTFDPGSSLLGDEATVIAQDDPRGLGGSTDVGDVSWLLPTAQFTAATWAPGTPAHSWQSTAFSGMSIGEKGMLTAAKTLALTALDLFHDPAQVAAARAAFDEARKGRTYTSRVPENQKPPLNYRGGTTPGQ